MYFLVIVLWLYFSFITLIYLEFVNDVRWAPNFKCFCVVSKLHHQTSFSH